MKLKYAFSFIIFITLVMTANCFAITGKDSWSHMRKSDEVMIQQPNFAGVFGPDGLFNACATDDEFKSIRPVETCIEYQRGRDSNRDYNCATYETRPVSISRTYIKNACIKHNSSGACTQYTSTTSIYPTAFQFAVIEAGNDEYGELLFTKTFALQSCD